MKKGICVWTIMVFLIFTLFSGCGKVTAQGLLKDAAKNAKKVSSARGTMDLALGMRVGQGRFSMNVEGGLTGNWEAVYHPGIFHMDGAMNVSLLHLSMDTEAYIVEEKEQAAAYLKLGDQWYKETASLRQSQSKDVTELWKIYTAIQNFALEEELGTVNGQDVYVVTGTLEGEALETFLEKSKIVFQEGSSQVEETDFSGISADVTLQIYKKSKTPASLTIVCTDGLEDLAGEGAASVTALSCTVGFEEYNFKGRLEVPKEAKEARELEEASIWGGLLGIH